MKRFLAMLLVCLTLVQMLPLGIHSHAQETEETEAAVAETAEVFETEEITYPLEPSVAEITEATLPPETTVPEETSVGTEDAEEAAYESLLDSILNGPAEETDEAEALPEEILVVGTPGISPQDANDHTYYESENNNDWSLADLIKNDYTVIASAGGYDTDFFAMRLDYKSKISIVTVAERSSFGMGFYDSSEKLLAKDIKGSKNDAGNYAYVIHGTYKAGKYYYVTLDSKQASSYNYIFYVEIEPLYLTCKHTNKKKVETVPPTCGSQGYTVYSCSACETTWKDKFVPATGEHVYDDDFDAYCNVCNKYRSVGIASGTCGDNLKWRISDDGVLIIGGTGPMYDYIVDYGGSGSKAPWNSYKDDITSVVIEYGATRIGNAAFYNLKQVTSISIPDSVSSIGNSAFFYCQKLSGIVIPEGVQAIERSAFNSCDALTSITLPQSLTSIGTLAFFGCHLLSEITFPEGLQSIGTEAFSYCNKLTTVTIPKNVSSIGSDAFASCSILKAIWVAPENGYYSSDSHGILYDKAQTVLIHVPVKIKGFVEIPDTVTRITGSFYGCDMLTGVTIPEGVTSIPAECFRSCDEMASASLPGSLTDIGEGAFEFCYALTSLTIPEKVTSVGAKAFYCCEALKSITFAGKAPTIGENAFYNVASDVFYQAGDTSWTESKRQNYGGSLNWIATCISGHVEVIDKPGVAPTCTEAGLSPDSHCSNCGEITSVQRVLPALGHDVVTDAYSAPTCLDTGLTEGSHCGRCGLVLVAQNVIPALGHDVVTDAYKAPLCEETGLTEGSHCGRCDMVFVAQNVIPALGHAYTDHWCDNCGRAEFVEVTSISTDRQSLAFGEEAVLTAILDYPIRPETEILWSLAEGDEAFATLVPGRETAVLTPKRLMEETTVTVFAKTKDGLHPASQISITLQALPADHILFAGQSVTLKPINPATNKAYTAAQLTWSMAEEMEPFIKLAKGKVTAQKVVEKVRCEVTATVKATDEILYYVIDVYPAVTQIEMKHGEETVNGKTVFVDYADQTVTLTVDTYPLDTLESVAWTISDKKGQFADYAIDGDRLTVSGLRGKAGTVTVKATVSAGVKKSATVKLSFGSFAREVTMTNPGQTTLRAGQSLNLSAWVSKPAVVTTPGVVWSVSDKNAVSVSAAGKVTAKNVTHPTTVTVTATSKDGRASAAVDLRIIPKDEGKLVLMCGDAYVTGTTKAMNYGETCRLEAYSIVNGEPVPEEVSWSSAKASIAYISRGTVTATGVGSAKITATAADGRTALVTIKVGTLVTDMKIITRDGKNFIEENGERLLLLASGKTAALVADVLTTGASKAVTWELTEGAEYAKLTNGKLTANKDLTKPVYVTVKATAKDGSGISDSLRVKIVPLATGVQIYQNGNRVRSNTTYVHDLLETDVIRLNARVYPAKANQAVVMTSSNRKTADFNEKGELVCYKTGTVTITATAQDGSGQKVTFKLTIVKRITDLKLKEDANLTVAGGKSLKLAPLVQISPSDATNKKLSWSVAPNPYGITVSASGVLSTKKVYEPVTVNIMVTTTDGSGKLLSFDVTVYPV